MDDVYELWAVNGLGWRLFLFFGIFLFVSGAGLCWAMLVYYRPCSLRSWLARGIKRCGVKSREREVIDM